MSKTIIAIDPGTHRSAWVEYTPEERQIGDFGITDNKSLVRSIAWERWRGDDLAIEMIASYGMPVGQEVFETCVWIGRFIEAFGCGKFVYRKDVKLHLCQSPRAKDANVRQAIIDLFPATGGGKTPQIGTKKQPGPLYGVSSHVWSALGVALTYAESDNYMNRSGKE